jgi:hypothetical protein
MNPTPIIVLITLFAFSVFAIEAVVSKKARNVRRFVCNFVGYTTFATAGFILTFGGWNAKHIWRTQEDEEIQEVMEKTLRDTGEFSPQSFFGTADTICFVPPYGDPRSIHIDLTPEAREDLNGCLMNSFGRSNNVWWIFGFKNNNMEFSRKMNTRTRVASIRARVRWETQCFRADRILLKLFSVDELGIEFNIIEYH